MKAQLLIAGGISILAAQSVLGTSRGFAPTGEVRQIGMAVEFFHQTNGRYPSDWADLNPMYKKPLDEVFTSIAPVSKRFKLITEPNKPVIPTTPRKVGGKVIAVSRDPMLEIEWKEGLLPMSGRSTVSESEPRHLIITLEQGHAMVWRLSPKETSELLGESGIAMPTPSGLGPCPYEQRALGKERGRVILWGMGIAVVVMWIVLRIRGRLKRPRETAVVA